MNEIEANRQKLSKLLTELSGNRFLMEEERQLLITIEGMSPHMSLGPILRMVEIVGRLCTLTDIRRNPPLASPLSGSLWRSSWRSDTSTERSPETVDNTVSRICDRRSRAG